MLRISTVALAALALAGCVTASEREQAAISADDSYCRSIGAPGTQPYVDCRLMVKNNRMQDATIRGAANGSPAGNLLSIIRGD